MCVCVCVCVCVYVCVCARVCDCRLVTLLLCFSLICLSCRGRQTDYKKYTKKQKKIDHKVRRVRLLDW